MANEKQSSFLDLVKPESSQPAVNDKGYRKTGKPHEHQHYEGQHAVQIGGAPASLLEKEVKSVVKDD